MVYLILAIGGLFALTGLYRFFLKASPREVRAAFLSVAAFAIALAALFLSVTGRFPVAIAILTALYPLGVAYYRNRKKFADMPKNTDLPLTQKEAFEVLGLKEGAGEDEIRAAHLRLMKKVHPDQAGSDWLAQKINAARDLLISR